MANTVSDAILLRNYAAIESRILQTMADVHIQSALVSNVEGRVLSHLRRNLNQLLPRAELNSQQLKRPSEATEILSGTASIVAWEKIGSTELLGWVRLEVSKDSAHGDITAMQKESVLLALFGILGNILLLGFFGYRTLGRLRAKERLLEYDNAALEKDASYDSLTGLPNRRLLMERLNRAIGRSRRSHELLAVCFLDLDGFKQVNDQFGHNMGDKLLIEVARRLNEIARSEDSIARFGGDEFVMLFGEGKTVHDIEQILIRVIAAINLPIQIDGHLAQVGASIGVTFYPLDEGDSATLLVHADQAMYEAKRAGRNHWSIYQPTATH